MKAQHYSTPEFPLWNMFRSRRDLQKTEKGFLEWGLYTMAETCDKKLKAIPDVSQAVSQFSFNLWGLKFEWLWRFRSMRHYFLAPGVADFCTKAVKEYSHEYNAVLPEPFDVEKPVDMREQMVGPYPRLSEEDFDLMYNTVFAASPTDPSKVKSGFVIHFPVEEKMSSIVVFPNAVRASGNNGTVDYVTYYFAVLQNGGKRGAMAHRDHSEQHVRRLMDSGNADLVKLVYGLSLYINAFPDAVHKAEPDWLDGDNVYRGRRFVVERSEAVDTEEKHAVSPHWRRGHLRLLTSERFTYKKGQVIYVSGSFVKGHAVEVDDDAPATQPSSENGVEKAA